MCQIPLSPSVNLLNDQQRNTLLALGIAVGMISIPLTWFTAKAIQVEGRMQVFFMQTVESMLEQVDPDLEEVNQVEINAWEGQIEFPFKTPLWIIVCIAIGAGVLQLMRSSEMFEVPLTIVWLAALTACAWIGGTFLYVLSTKVAELGVGAFLGLASGCIPLLCLVVPPAKAEASPTHGA